MKHLMIVNAVRAASLAASVLVLSVAAVSAQAQELSIAAGGTAGEYTNTIVPAIDAALQQADTSYTAKAVATDGSVVNLEMLKAGEVDAALIQLDVLALNQGPDDQIQLIEMIAPEALLCAARTDGRVRSYHNLTDDRSDPLVLSIGAEGSGTAATMSYILALDPDFDSNNVAFIYNSNTEAELDRLTAGTRDLVCFVMIPNPDNPLIAKVNDSDELHFIDFISAYALQASVNDTAVYETSVVPVSKGLWGFRANKVQTLTTWVALATTSNANPELVAALTDVAGDPELLPPTTAAGKAKRLYGEFKDKAKSYTATAKEKTLELSSKAKEKAIEIGAVAREKAIQAKDAAVDMTNKAVEKAGELKDRALSGDDQPASEQTNQ